MATRLSFPQGDTVIFQSTIENPDGTPVDLTVENVLLCTVKRSIQDSDAAAVWQGSLLTGDIVIGVEAGVAEITIPASATRLMRTGRLYFWDIQLVSAFHEFSPCGGTILTTAEVTR